MNKMVYYQLDNLLLVSVVYSRKKLQLAFFNDTAFQIQFL